MIRSAEVAENGKPLWALRADGVLEINAVLIDEGVVHQAQIAEPYNPAIVWRPRLAEIPARAPTSQDVSEGRAEYVLSGPYRLSEGAKIEVVDGQVLWSSGKL